MYHSRKWEAVSAMSTMLLAVFVEVIPRGISWWWSGVVILFAAVSILAMLRAVRLQRIPKLHPLRAKVQSFICDLSEAKDISEGLTARAVELEQDFQKEGMWWNDFPKLKKQECRAVLNQAAVAFQSMLNHLPY